MAPLHNPLLEGIRFPAVAPPLPLASSGPDQVVRAALRGEAPAGELCLDGVTAGGIEVAIALTAIAPGTIRVRLTPRAAVQPRVALARAHVAASDALMEQSSSGCIRFGTHDLTARVELDPFRLSFLDRHGRILLAQDSGPTDVTGRIAAPPFGISCNSGGIVACHDTFVCEPDEHFYGFGEKFTNLDKRGQWLEMWNYDAHGVNSERAYKNVPFFISSRGYGIFVDSVTPIRFDMAASNHATFSVIVPEDRLDYYVIAGADPLENIRRYSDLVGRPSLPPKWAFGLWVSSGFKADSAEATFLRARELRLRNIPADVVHLDCFWQRFGCWSDLEWDTDVFPDPEWMLHEIHTLGFRVCLWINSYIGVHSDRFRVASERGWLLRTQTGEPYVLDLWGGSHPPVSILDVTHPEAAEWFVARLRKLLRMGADVFKTDFGEGVPADAVAHNGTTGARLHNLYTLIYNDLVAGVTAAETGSPIVWGRSTYSGGQRHAAQWGGDPNCTYADLASTLRGGLSLSASGHPFWSHDIGGFKGQPTADLFIRWAQFGLLSPLSRLHGTTSRLPWDYGQHVEGIFRDLARLRYRLLPYLYSCATHAAESGEPIMRALPLVYPDEPTFAAIDLEYLLGPDLLVAPIYNAEGIRPVVVPPGRWVDFWTNAVVVGPCTLRVEMPLDRFPLYVRADALIPTMQPVEHLDEAPWDLVTFDAYLLDRGHVTLRDVDGRTDVTVAFRGSTLDVNVAGAKQRVGLRLMPVVAREVERVLVNGVALERHELLTLEPTARAGWAMAADDTLVTITA
jgi:alpha-D-xyloside xylohydrolase